jgi:hypothetical protein
VVLAARIVFKALELGVRVAGAPVAHHDDLAGVARVFHELLGGLLPGFIVIQTDVGNDVRAFHGGLNRHDRNARRRRRVETRQQRSVEDRRNDAIRLLGDDLLESRGLTLRIPIVRAGADYGNAELLCGILEALVDVVPIGVIVVDADVVVYDFLVGGDAVGRCGLGGRGSIRCGSCAAKQREQHRHGTCQCDYFRRFHENSSYKIV